jgi:hypothetical protein
LGLSCGCPLGTRVDPLIAYIAIASHVYFPKLKNWFVCDKSHSSASLITHQSVACLVTPQHPSLVSPSVVSAGDLTMVALGSPHLLVVHQQPPMLGESVQDALGVQMPQV